LGLEALVLAQVFLVMFREITVAILFSAPLHLLVAVVEVQPEMVMD
jgi:hypothetical protein